MATLWLFTPGCAGCTGYTGSRVVDAPAAADQSAGVAGAIPLFLALLEVVHVFLPLHRQ